MCLLTIASALIAIGAASGLLMTTDILPVNSVLLPFSVFLVPFFGVTNFMTSTAAAMFLPTAVSVVWLCFAVGFWCVIGKNKRLSACYNRCTNLQYTVGRGTQSGFSCGFAAIHLLPSPRRVNNRYMGNRRGDRWSPVHPFRHSVGGQWPPLRDKYCR